jgi:hypothetical protein
LTYLGLSGCNKLSNCFSEFKHLTELKCLLLVSFVVSRNYNRITSCRPIVQSLAMKSILWNGICPIWRLFHYHIRPLTAWIYYILEENFQAWGIHDIRIITFLCYYLTVDTFSWSTQRWRTWDWANFLLVVHILNTWIARNWTSQILLLSLGRVAWNFWLIWIWLKQQVYHIANKLKFVTFVIL